MVYSTDDSTVNLALHCQARELFGTDGRLEVGQCIFDEQWAFLPILVQKQLRIEIESWRNHPSYLPQVSVNDSARPT